MILKCVGFLIVAMIYMFPSIISKPMYSLVHERAELLMYNDSIVTKDVKFSFRKVNRTNFAFNVSFNVLKDLTDRRILLGVHVDKLFGTEFKRTGTMLTLNICKFWQRNMFGMREQLNKNGGHMEACNVTKGRYWATNFVPDENMFPKFLPFGSYRVEITVLHEDTSVLFRMYWYARVDQLVKWNGN